METDRPEILNGCTYRVHSPFGAVFVTLNEDRKGYPFELFLNTGKRGSDIAAEAEAIGRLCTLLLQLPSAVPEVQRIQNIIRHLNGIGGSRSIPDTVAVALSLYLQDKRKNAGGF